MAVFSTVILGALGTAIGKYFQDRTEKNARAREKRASELKTANEIFSRLSKRMDEYLFRMKDVYDAYKHDVAAKDKDKKWEEFQKINVEWRSTLNLEYSKVLKYFGEKTGKQFTEIWGHFVTLRRELDELCYENVKVSDMPKDERGETPFMCTRSRLVKIIRQYNLEMLRMIEDENVGALRKYVL